MKVVTNLTACDRAGFNPNHRKVLLFIEIKINTGNNIVAGYSVYLAFVGSNKFLFVSVILMKVSP
jgi:hypothetical protein